MPLDITLRSVPETEGRSHTPSLEAVRFYESSWPGLVTMVTARQEGLRLTREQVISLVDALEDYLLSTHWANEPTPEEAA